jgi:hypothetical protein
MIKKYVKKFTGARPCRLPKPEAQTKLTIGGLERPIGPSRARERLLPRASFIFFSLFFFNQQNFYLHNLCV